MDNLMIIDNAENDEDLDRQWSDWNQMTHANRRRSNAACLNKYGMTNLDRYEHLKSGFNQAPIDDVELQDTDVTQDTQDTDGGTIGESYIEEGLMEIINKNPLISSISKILKIKDKKIMLKNYSIQKGSISEVYKASVEPNQIVEFMSINQLEPVTTKDKKYIDPFMPFAESVASSLGNSSGVFGMHGVRELTDPYDNKKYAVITIEDDHGKFLLSIIAKGKTDDNAYMIPFYYRQGSLPPIMKATIKSKSIKEAVELIYPTYNPSITTDEALKQGGFYDHHGVWNSIIRIPEDPKRIYRGRVECLIIRDGEVYLCKRPTNEYRLPGGSFEVKNDNETQCYNECREESRILIKNIRFSGITYRRTYSYPADWARDMPVQWTGQYIEVYVADYDKYYNGQVDPNDRDEDMFNNGRFYNIDEIYDILSDEHKKAIDKCVRNINIKEETEETYEVIGGSEHINLDTCTPSPLDSLSNEMYDAAKEWSARSNIKMVLERYNLDDLEREYSEFMLQTYYHRKISNQESIRIFGFNNLVHYGYLKSKMLKKDETQVDIIDVINNDTESSSSVSEFYAMSILPTNIQKKIDIIKEELEYDYDKITVHNMLDDLWTEKANFAQKSIVRKFIYETINSMDNGDYHDLLPYFTPNEMTELGVFNEDANDNYYKVSSNKNAESWFDLYTRTGCPGNTWYRGISEAYGNMVKNPTKENKQRVLEFGWNPEIDFNLDIVKETSKLTKKKLGNTYNIEIVNITEALNDLDDYLEIPYTAKNIGKYELSSYLLRSIEMEHTTGRLFTDFNGQYVAHITLFNRDIMGISSWYKGPELLSELIDWAISEKKANRCFCSRSDITLKRVLSSKGFIPMDDERVITYVRQEETQEDNTTNQPGTILTQGFLHQKYKDMNLDHKFSAFGAREILGNMLNDIGYQGYSQYKNCFELRDVESDDGMYIFAKWDTSSLDGSQLGVFFDIFSNIRDNIVTKLDGFIINGVNRSSSYGFLGTLPGPMISEAAMPSKERNNLKDSDFGLPKERKYPLNDESHVRSAIKFFNYVEAENEAELAKNIIKKINKYDIDINIGKDNRFAKYYTPANEAASKKDNVLMPVYIVTCYTASPMGIAIQKFTHTLYTHASIGFDSALDKLYSFNVVHSDGKRGGLSLESVNQYINDNRDADLNVSVVYLKEKDYNILKDRLDMYLANVGKTSYSFINLFNIVINKAEDGAEQFSMVCSQFVDSMFKAINVDLTNKPSNLVTPGDLSRVDNPKVYKVYEGKAINYNPKKVKVILSRLVGYVSPIKEATFIRDARIGIYHALPIFEAKELPIGFDDSGALLIKNYKTIDYDMEYSRSNKLLKSYKAHGNWEAMKYELCKLWFMNTVLLKKIEVAKDDEEKAKYVKIRAKIMNDFTIYLNEVNKNVSGFNFSEYYEQTPFGDAVIRISGSTLKFSAIYLKQALKAIL